MNKQHIYRLKVFYEDTDAGGAVYHANYLKFMDRARTDWCNAIGFGLNFLAEEGYLLVVRNAWLDYLHPAKLGDHLEVVTEIEKLSGVRIVFQQTIRSVDDPDLIYCKGLITIVSVNQYMQPRKLLPELVESLTNVEIK